MNSKDKDANGVRAILPRPEGRGLPRTWSIYPQIGRIIHKLCEDMDWRYRDSG